MTETTIKIHEIAIVGLPDMKNMTGRVAFIFDGCIVSGWPLDDGDENKDYWESNGDIGNGMKFADVTHWVEFPVPVWDLTKTSP